MNNNHPLISMNMKRSIILTVLAVLLLAAPAAAQVQLDEKAFCASWTCTLQGVKIHLTFGKDHRFEQRTDVPLPGNAGTLHVTAPGTWRADSNTVALTVDAERVTCKYEGGNAQMKQLVEQQFQANRDQMLQQIGGGREVLMRDVIVADNLLLFTQEMPNPLKPTETQSMKMTLTRE